MLPFKRVRFWERINKVHISVFWILLGIFLLYSTAEKFKKNWISSQIAEVKNKHYNDLNEVLMESVCSVVIEK